MRIDHIEYWPTRRGVVGADVRKRLPKWLSHMLMDPDPELGPGLRVDVQDTEAIAALDEHFRIGRSLEIVKRRRVEITADELDAFDLYRIQPSQLTAGRGFKCEYGLGVDEAMRAIVVTKRLRAEPALYEFDRWTSEPLLLVTRTLRDRFEAAGVSGLSYVPATCKFPSQEAFIARLRGHVVAEADAIVAQSVGDDLEHHAVVAPYLFSPRYRPVETNRVDFLIEDEVRAGGEMYRLKRSHWMVTKKVVRVLLESRVPGLGLMTFKLKQRFVPVVNQETPDQT